MMSTTCIPSLETLPIELIYRIFDHLDGQIIVLSLRHVCKRLHTIVDTYLHQSYYKLNFERISLTDFVRVCRRIKLENVISLTFSGQCTTSDLISLFLLFFPIEQLTRLRSLTLSNVKDEHLNLILKHAVTSPLISLSIQEQDYSNRSTTTTALLSATIERAGLQNLTLSLMDGRMDEIKWPTSSAIQHLILYHCHLKHFPMIFRHFSSLKTLSIKYCDLNDYLAINSETPLDLIPMRQLTSLVMEDIVINMSKIISILSNTPSLTHLRLTGNISNQIDFQWEQLIRTTLPLLNEFEFFFYTRVNKDNASTYTEACIAPFRTSFWLEIKNWFVTCDQIKRLNNHDGNLNYDIYLYSIPVRNYYFEYYPDSIKMASSTSMEMNNDIAVMDSVRTVYLKTEKVVAATTTQKVETTPTYVNSTKIALPTHLFRKALDLHIRFNTAWSLDFVQRVSSLIDLSHLEKLTLIDDFPQDFYPNTTMSFIHLLEHAYNIHSLVITVTWLDETCNSNMENFCSVLPHHIKHLEIDVDSMSDMKLILDRLEHLSSVTFRFLNGEKHWQTKIMEWLSKRRNSACCPDLDTLHIWLGKKKMYQTN